MNEELYEDFNLLTGEPDDLKNRAGVLCWFLAMHGYADQAERIMTNLDDAETEDELTDTIQVLIHRVLDVDEKDIGDSDWLSLYTGLFNSSPLVQESHYIPKDGEMEKITRECLKQQKRIRIDLEEGAIA